MHSLDQQIAELQRLRHDIEQSWTEKSRVVQTLDVMIGHRTWSYPGTYQQHQAGPTTSAPGY